MADPVADHTCSGVGPGPLLLPLAEKFDAETAFQRLADLTIATHQLNEDLTQSQRFMH